MKKLKTKHKNCAHSVSRPCVVKESAQARERYQGYLVSLFSKSSARLTRPKESEPDGLNTFCATRFQNLKILHRMYELISGFATQKFCSF